MNEDFYVGYSLKAPVGLGRTVAGIAAGIVLAVCIADTFLAFGQPPFAASKFEFGVYQDYVGMVEKWPYPTLVTDNASFLLVAPGKHGLTEAVKGLQSKRVRLKGSLIERVPDRMIEVIPGSIAADTPQSQIAPRSAVELGPVTLRGEIVDTKCYLGVMNPGEHKVHRDCAVRCISGGVPPAFLAWDASGDAESSFLSAKMGAPSARRSCRLWLNPWKSRAT